MPIYEYKCSSCGHTFEGLVLSQYDEKNIRCPDCGSKNYERIMSRCFSMGFRSSVSSCGPQGFS